MHYFAGIVSFAAAVAVFYGMTDVWPAASYKEEEVRVDAARQEKSKSNR
jgi:hypothetical protein